MLTSLTVSPKLKKKTEVLKIKKTSGQYRRFICFDILNDKTDAILLVAQAQGQDSVMKYK